MKTIHYFKNSIPCLLIIFLFSMNVVDINAQKITQQPADVVFCLPDTRATVSFTVVVSPVTSYQWQAYNPKTRVFEDLTDLPKIITGTNTATLTVYRPAAGWSTSNSATVRVKITYLKNPPIYSREAVLEINSPATITADPVSATIWIGETNTFSASSSGKPTPDKQWQRYLKIGFLDISGATSSTYTTGSAGTYRLEVSNSCGTDYSSSAVLTTVGITSHPSNVTVCSGHNLPVSFTVGASGATAYQWQRLNVRLWENISGATSSTYTITPPLKGGFTTSYSGQFRCVVTFKIGTQNSNSAYFTVNAKPTITTHPASQTKNEGESVTFNVAASSTLTKTYQWYKDNNPISGATSTSLTLNNLNLSDAGGYKCTVTNDCGSTTSNTAILSVNKLDWAQGWFSQKENTEPENAKYMNDVHAIDANNAWAAISEVSDNLLHTNNGGATWTYVNTNVTNKSSWQTIFFTDANHGWVGGYKVIAYTTDGGTTWQQWYDVNTHYFYDLYFVSSTTGWAVGYEGRIYKTTDGGVNWNPQTSSTNANLNQVHFKDANHGIVVGQSGTILYTTNGGTTWLTPTTNPAEVALNAVYMTHNDTAFIAGSYQSGEPYPYYYMHMKTTDGGITWSKIAGPNYTGYDLEFVNSKEGWMAASSGKIFYTNDGGQKWYEQVTKTSQGLYAISMVDNKNGWAVGYTGALQRTAFGGCYLPRVSLYADTAFCAGASYRLRADTFGVSNPTYLWSTGSDDGSIYATAPGGKYWVDVWNACGDKTTDTVNVIFHPLPEAYAGEDTAICYGDTIQLGASGGVSYTWDPGSYLSDPNIPNPLTSPPVGNTKYEVTVTDANECRNTDEVLVTVYKIPTSTFSAPANACESLFEMITYTGNASFAANYAWDFDGGTTHDMGNQSYEVWWDMSGERTISLAVEENGCVSDTTRVTIDVNPIPVSEFSFQPRVCGDDTVQIVYEGAGSAEAYYDWNFDGASIISGENEGPYQVNWATGGTKTISLQVTKDGCISELNEEQIVIAYPYEGEEICLVSVDLDTWKNTVIWEKTANAGIDYYNVYRESNVSGKYDSIGTVFYNELSVFVDQGTSPRTQQYLYKISAVDTCGNESGLSNYHKTILLQYDGSSGGVNLRWDKYEIEGVPLNFDSYIIYRSTDSTDLKKVYTISGSLNSWIDTSIVANSMKHYYRIAGVKGDTCYPAKFKDKKAGTGPYSQSMSNIEDNRLQVGINDLRNDMNNLMIYPNPFRQQTRITYSLDRPSEVKIEIFNLLGARTADIVNMRQDPGEFSYDLNASDIGVSEGIFYLRFTVNGNTTVKKLILTK
jgi:photosystem II stability/assembly factor-like uncharacterized protein